jgi:hypothetical protein
VLQDPKATTETIYAAARASGKRVLLSRGWAALGSGIVDRPSNVFLLSDCPHAWLFPKCSAAIHHGGAGTTAASLRAGLPTLVVCVKVLTIVLLSGLVGFLTLTCASALFHKVHVFGCNSRYHVKTQWYILQVVGAHTANKRGLGSSSLSWFVHFIYR